MRLTVKNHTRFQTKDLQTLIRKAATDDGITASSSHLMVFVKPHRRPTKVRGRASIGGTHIWLWFGHRATPQQALWVIAHELFHIRGLHHKHYGHDPGRHYLDLPDAAVPPLRLTPIKPPAARPSLRLRRYHRTLQHIAEKEKALKRLTTQLRKWRTKRRYYERILNAAGLLPTAPPSPPTGEEP